MKAYRHRKEYPQKAKDIISFSAFLLSIFIYISIFYIFDLSPSSLFNTTIFWFLISNTLILIIAADYGAFSSSKQGQDYLHEEYLVYGTSTVLHVQQVENSEKKKVVSQKSETKPENKLEIVLIKSGPENPSNGIQETMLMENAFEEVHLEDEKNSKAICCSEETDQKREASCTGTENNELSSMTDEELNKRVEEFIQKFNRQIRLQRAKNFR